MLDSKYLYQNIETVAQNLKQRGFHLDIAALNNIEERRKEIQVKSQEYQNIRNQKSKEIGMKKAKKEDATDLLEEMKTLSDESAELEKKLDVILNEQKLLLERIPNLLGEKVPTGKSDSDNLEIYKWGEIKNKGYDVKDHIDLTAIKKVFNPIDCELGTKLSGTRFTVMMGKIASLHRALAQFMINTHVYEHGYTEVNVPNLVSPSALYGTGQLPNLEDDLFKIEGERELYMIPTSEVPVTNLVAGEILTEDMLPLTYTCYSACFRKEAGSYGKDTKGMFRQHQFEKVELVHIVRPQDSEQALETLCQHAENILQKLELPYRKMALCSGDIGFSSSMTYDLEVWLPSQQQYREISSCSNMKDFQSRRMSARYKNKETGKNELVHTLNGSGLAVGRTLIAVLENYQTSNGDVMIPKVLQPYMNNQTLISFKDA